MKLIELNIEKIFALCKKYKVRKLYVFGSILTDKFNDNSDIDFSVDFDRDIINRENLDWADIFFGFIHEMESIVKRRVDVVVDDYINNDYFREELNKTKRLIYG